MSDIFCYFVSFVMNLRFCSHLFSGVTTKLYISSMKIRKPVSGYNESIMGRPSKFNEDSVGRFLKLIASGCTVRDAARDIGATEMTIYRWRKSHKEFNTAVLAAMREGWDYVAERKAEGCRTYRNGKEIYKTNNLPTPPEKAHTAAPVANDRQVSTYHQQKYLMGLPIKPRPHDYSHDVPYFINPDTCRVEKIEKGVLQSCRLDVWERKHQPSAETIFIWEWL